MPLEDHAPPGRWAYWDWDLGSGQLSFDASLEHLLGWTAAEVDGDPSRWRALIHPDDRARVHAAVAHALADSERWSLTYRVRDRNGTFVEVLDRASVLRENGSVTRACGSLVASADTAEPARGAFFSRVDEGEHHFRTFIDWLPQLAWTATADGWIHYYNRRWYDYTGTTLAQMEGWGWVSVHDPDDVLRVLRILRNAFNSGEPWEDEFRLRRGSDGMLRWHLSRAMPLRDPSGRIVRWFGTNTDVHDQKLAAEAYSRMLIAEQQARREAQSANRAKDEFLAIVSHELRTPLNAILGWTQLLIRAESRFEDREALRDAVAKIDANARLQAKLIEDLLDLSRIMAGKLAVDLTPVAVGEAVRRALDALRHEADRSGVALELADGAPRVLVRGHAERLQQIVSNLVGNAIKFSHEGASVTVEIARHGETVAIIVRDTGAGIAPAMVPHIFERFQQADTSSTRRHGGLGLGLAIVRQLVDLHGGEVAAESPGEGMGATFTVRLAVHVEAGDEATPVAPASEPATVVPLTGIRVLVVDDELSARDVIGEMLLFLGATVTKVSSVHEALRAFRLDRPDVVVSDLAMPELDGYALLDRIRALPGEAAGTPCIALTAHASAEDHERALQRGFDRYLTKPVDVVRLSHDVAELSSRDYVSAWRNT